MKFSINDPLSWKTTISFLFLSTLLILLIAWLTISGVLPIDRAIDYTNEQASFLKAWITVAMFLGVLFPAIALAISIRYPQPRKVLSFYLLVLLVQIITEQVLSEVLFSSIVVTIGTIYTAFRLWQLWEGQKLLAAKTETVIPNQKLLNILLRSMLLFWSSNLLMLLVLPWRIIAQHA